MERDQAISELNELKDWAEPLKARYDIMERNSQECQKSYDTVVVDCSQFRKQIQELQFQLSFSQRQESNVRVQNDELTRKVKRYREQRDFYADERKQAIAVNETKPEGNAVKCIGSAVTSRNTKTKSWKDFLRRQESLSVDTRL